MTVDKLRKMRPAAREKVFADNPELRTAWEKAQAEKAHLERTARAASQIAKDETQKRKEQYIKATGDEDPCTYECMECGCIFFGKWHSKYTMNEVVCPVCKDETDPLFIRIKEV